MNIIQSKVTINLDNDTIEIEDDYSIDDILESAGVLTPEEAKELMDGYLIDTNIAIALLAGEKNAFIY